MGTCLELDPAVVLQAEVNGKPEFDVPKHLRLKKNKYLFIYLFLVLEYQSVIISQIQLMAGMDSWMDSQVTNCAKVFMNRL